MLRCQQLGGNRLKSHIALWNPWRATHAAMASTVTKVKVDSSNNITDVIVEENVVKSKRQAFRDIIPDPKTVNYLDEHHLGYCSRRRSRVAIAKKFGPKPHPLPVRTKSKDAAKDGNAGNAGKHAVREVRSHTGPDSPYPFNTVGELVFTVSSPSDIPSSVKLSSEPPEVAVIGRSNVGKSTLMNALLGFDASFVQQAKTSDKPGETKDLFFYRLGSNKGAKSLKSSPPPPPNSSSSSSSSIKPSSSSTPALVLVDMPGYGFVFMNNEDADRCAQLCSHYLTSRSSLKRVLLLLDARHGFKLTDKQFFHRLLFPTQYTQSTSEENVPPSSSSSSSNTPSPSSSSSTKKSPADIKWKLQVVLTKCDLVERMTLARRIQHLRETLDDFLPGTLSTSLPIMPVSCYEGGGVLQLKSELGALVVRGPSSNQTLKEGKSHKNNSHNHSHSQGSDTSKQNKYRRNDSSTHTTNHSAAAPQYIRTSSGKVIKLRSGSTPPQTKQQQQQLQAARGQAMESNRATKATIRTSSTSTSPKNRRERRAAMREARNESESVDVKAVKKSGDRKEKEKEKRRIEKDNRATIGDKARKGGDMMRSVNTNNRNESQSNSTSNMKSDRNSSRSIKSKEREEYTYKGKDLTSQKMQQKGHGKRVNDAAEDDDDYDDNDSGDDVYDDGYAWSDISDAEEEMETGSSRQRGAGRSRVSGTGRFGGGMRRGSGQGRRVAPGRRIRGKP